MIDPTDQGSLSECDDELLANLVEEISQQLEAGGSIDLGSYYRQYPSFAGQLRQLVPSLDILHRIGSLASRTTAADSQTSDAPVGQLGDFRIGSRIGHGGMGVVFEAEQVSLGRRVALKILPFAALLNERQLRRFQKEATAAARLQHPHIVPVYSVGCERGIHYYSMRLIDGPSLAEVIAQLRQGRMWGGYSAARDQPDAAETVVDAAANPLTPDAEGEGHYRGVARVGREAAAALHYAHQQGVLHRDIKPSNLLLDATGHVWIVDFGLARVEDESQLTRTGDILGTLRYMSPEQAAGRRGKIDARSDVYSLGATLYELATLQPVFDNADRREVLKQVVAGNPVAPHKVDSRISRPLSLVISKAMARRPDERYQSAQDLADDLQRYLDGEPVQAKPSTLIRRARAWSRRHRLASTAIVGLLVVALLVPAITHHFTERIPDDSQSKGEVMKPSTAAKVASAVAAVSMIASSVSAKKPASPPPLPNVRYQISFVSFPNNGEYSDEVRIRSDGQVTAVVGSFYTPFPIQHAFLYSPVFDANEAIDLNDWFIGASDDPVGMVPTTFPPEYYLRKAKDINDEMVVVGTLKDDQSGNLRGFAVDLSTWPPVLDLLPAAGCLKSIPLQINENGDILMVCEIAAGSWGTFLFNPGYYGAPQVRIVREVSPLGTPLPLDFSGVDVSAMMLPIVVGSYDGHALNNPTAERGAQIVGKTDAGFPFQYTMGASDPLQVFGFPCQDVGGLNDHGTFCGATSILVSRNKYEFMPFRHAVSMDTSEPGIVTGAAIDYGRWPTGINNSGDLVTRLQVYRDDWGRWIDLDDLVIGDVTRWNASALKMWPAMCDRIDVGPYADPAGVIVTGESNFDEIPDALIILTPVAAQ